MISVYLSMPSGELSTRAIVQDALTSGKQVFIPYIHNVESPATQQKISIMDMLALESMDEFDSLEPDKWGIPSLQPTQVANKSNCLGGHGVSSETTQGHHGLDLIVMPGMAFDQGFRRLGHGKGYYDHFLTRYWGKEKNNNAATPKMPFLGKKQPASPKTPTKNRASLTRPIVALCLQEQMLAATEEIPVTDHDWPLDAIITGEGQLLVHQR